MYITSHQKILFLAVYTMKTSDNSFLVRNINKAITIAGQKLLWKRKRHGIIGLGQRRFKAPNIVGLIDWIT